jgi:hypothetical protein
VNSRKLTAAEVTFTVEAEQDDLRVRGNALASGDDAEDKACEDEILRRLDAGDVWAWACVTVKASWRGFVGADTLGACSYEHEGDFRECDYFTDMCKNALEDLNRTIAEIEKRLVR